MMSARASSKTRLSLAGVALFFLAVSSLRPCTIAVVSGKVTRDGRPLLWKNRDVDNPDVLVRYFSGKKYVFLGIVDAGDDAEVYAGINAAGLAIVNSVSEDLEGTGATYNGDFIKRVLEECASMSEVESLLLATNGAACKTQANFGVIDALGNGAIFETGNKSFAKYDVDRASSGLKLSLTRDEEKLLAPLEEANGLRPWSGLSPSNASTDVVEEEAKEKAAEKAESRSFAPGDTMDFEEEVMTRAEKMAPTRPTIGILFLNLPDRFT